MQSITNLTIYLTKVKLIINNLIGKLKLYNTSNTS